LCAVNSNETEFEIIKKKPFGGMNMIFTGDLYQLRPVNGSAVYENENLSFASQKGKNIWMQINEYQELIENVRFKDDSSPEMQRFLNLARKGIVNKRLLAFMNTRIMIDEKEAKRKAGPNAVWVAHTNMEVNRFNVADFKSKLREGATHFRIIAKHTPSKSGWSMPDAETRQKLLKVNKDKNAPTHVDLAIGSRVSCTANLGTQIGTYLYT
jgi:hypothetical protein